MKGGMEGGGREGEREDGTGEEHCMTTFYSVKFTLLGILHATIRHWSISICIAIYGKQLLAWGRAVDMRMRATDYKYWHVQGNSLSCPTTNVKSLQLNIPKFHVYLVVLIFAYFINITMETTIPWGCLTGCTA